MLTDYYRNKEVSTPTLTDTNVWKTLFEKLLHRFLARTYSEYHTQATGYQAQGFTFNGAAEITMRCKEAKSYF